MVDFGVLDKIMLAACGMYLSYFISLFVQYFGEGVPPWFTWVMIFNTALLLAIFRYLREISATHNDSKRNK